MRNKRHPEPDNSARTGHVMAAMLLCALLGLYAYRHYFSARELPPPEIDVPAPVSVIEVAGDASAPGVYFFDHVPTVAEALAASGERRAHHEVDVFGGMSREITTGTLLQVQKVREKITVNFLQMEAEKRVLFEIPLDLNAVSEEDLVSIPGIGPATARGIVAHRNNHGNFLNVEALKTVKGIGHKRFERIRKYFSAATDSTQ